MYELLLLTARFLYIIIIMISLCYDMYIMIYIRMRFSCRESFKFLKILCKCNEKFWGEKNRISCTGLTGLEIE